MFGRLWGNLLGFFWRRMPRRLLHWGVWITQPRFAVSAGAIIFDDRGRVLLLRHVFRHGSGWGIPGGFLHRGEQPEVALRRELREEIGLEVEDLTLASVRTIEHVGQVEILYYGRARGCAQARSFEIKGAAWFDPADLPRDLMRSQKVAIRRASSTWQRGQGATKSGARAFIDDRDRSS